MSIYQAYICITVKVNVAKLLSMPHCSSSECLCSNDGLHSCKAIQIHEGSEFSGVGPKAANASYHGLFKGVVEEDPAWISKSPCLSRLF
jgi:hypothetical protein